MEHPEFRFFRPILWKTGLEETPYFLGGTATIVRMVDHEFVISAKHALSKEGYTMSDAFIPHRLGSQYPVRIGNGVSFSPIDEDEEDTASLDVQIHRILEQNESEKPLQRGEFLDLTGFSHGDERFGLQISGFPKQLGGIDYDSQLVWGDGLTVRGEYGGDDESSAGMAIFRSDELIGLDADGFSGGAITSEILGNVQFQGLVVQGAGSPEIDFVRYVTADRIRQMFSTGWKALTSTK